MKHATRRNHRKKPIPQRKTNVFDILWTVARPCILHCSSRRAKIVLCIERERKRDKRNERKTTKHLNSILTFFPLILRCAVGFGSFKVGNLNFYVVISMKKTFYLTTNESIFIQNCNFKKKLTKASTGPSSNEEKYFLINLLFELILEITT